MFQFAFVGIAGGGGVVVTPSGSWANIGPGTSPLNNSNITLNFAGAASLTLRAIMGSGTFDAGIKTLQAYKGGVAGSLVSAANGAQLHQSFAPGDTIRFEAIKGGTTGTVWSSTITVMIVETGQVLGTFTVSVTAP